VETALRLHCESAYPLEACGAIFGHGDGESEPWSIVEIRPAPNQHGDDQRRRYLVPPEFQLLAEREASRQNLDVIGYFHSHPDHPAQPSEYDRAHAWEGYLYAICAVAQGRATDFFAFALEQQGGAFRPIPIERPSDSPQSPQHFPPEVR
jgi:proteasome lid subunit RPN8/RPN11